MICFSSAWQTFISLPAIATHTVQKLEMPTLCLIGALVDVGHWRLSCLREYQPKNKEAAAFVVKCLALFYSSTGCVQTAERRVSCDDEEQQCC